MAHYEQKKFVEICFNNLKQNNNFKKYSVIEVGSMDVNGSVREYLLDNEYIGVDLEKGPNVDYVLNGEDLEKIGKKFNIAISCECLEHTKNWAQVFDAMYKVLNDDGILIFTCASRGRLEHGTTRTNPENTFLGNYYKNLNASDFKKNFDLNNMFSEYFFFYNIYSFDLYFVGGKKILNTSLDLKKIKAETSQIKNFNKELYIKRIIYSHILSDKGYQNFRFLRRKITNTLKKLLPIK